MSKEIQATEREKEIRERRTRKELVLFKKALRIAWKALDKIDNGTNTQSLIACGAKQDIERLGGRVNDLLEHLWNL